MLKLSDAGLAVVTAVTGRLPLRLRSAFLLELAAAFAGRREPSQRLARTPGGTSATGRAAARLAG